MMPKQENPQVQMQATGKGRSSYNAGERFWASPREAARMVAQGIAGYARVDVAPAPARKPVAPAPKPASVKGGRVTKPARSIEKSAAPAPESSEPVTPAE